MAKIFLQNHTSFTLFTFSLPFLFCLLSYINSSSLPPPPSSAPSTLSSRGYSLFATALSSPSFSHNFSGTILAPPDFAFSFSASIFHHHKLHVPPRLTPSLLLYHTLLPSLTFRNLSRAAALVSPRAAEFQTRRRDDCLFFHQKPNNEITISSSKTLTRAATIRHPDLYVDDYLVVHGIDNVLDPTSATKCSSTNPTAEIKSQLDRSFLDHAIRALNKRGFAIVATSMAVKRSALTALTAVTIFAPADEALLSFSNGFRYDFLHHVVPRRLRLTELSRIPVNTTMETMARNKIIVVGKEDDGSLTVNGVKVNLTEVYYNPWIVVFSVIRSLDDAAVYVKDKSLDTGDYSTDYSSGNNIPAAAPYFPSGFSVSGVPSTAPVYSERVTDFPGEFSETPSPSPINGRESPSHSPTNVEDSPSPSLIYGEDSPSTSPIIPPTNKEEIDSIYFPEKSSDSASPAFPSESPLTFPPSQSPLPAEETPLDLRCEAAIFNGVDSAVLLGKEGGDLYCPATVRKLEEMGSYDVEVSQPLDGVSEILSKEEDQSVPLIRVGGDDGPTKEDEESSGSKDEMFMADDLFFYN